MLIFESQAPQPAWFGRVDALARSRLGRDSSDVQALAGAVRGLSEAYTRRGRPIRQLDTDTDALWARLGFFLPRDLAKVQLPLLELASVGALARRSPLRVLDLGCGPGTASLGIAQLALREGFSDGLQVTGVDTNSVALELFAGLLPAMADLPGVPIELRPVQAPLQRLPRAVTGQRYDLIVVSLALNELALELGDDAQAPGRAHEWLVQVSRWLQPDGALIVIEPALREQSRRLHALRDRIGEGAGPPFLFAPCVRRGPCPMLTRQRDWCHERVPATLPTQLAAVARAAGLRDQDLTFSYLTLHAMPRSLGERAGSQAPYRIVSGPLASKGKLELDACGEHGITRLMRLERDQDAHPDLDDAGRGSLLSLPTAVDAERLRLAGDVPITLWQRTRR